MSNQTEEVNAKIAYQLLQTITDNMLKNVLSGNAEDLIWQANDVYNTALAEMGSITGQLEKADDETRQTFRRMFFQMLFENTEDSRMALAAAMGKLSSQGYLKLEDAAKNHIQLMAERIVDDLGMQILKGHKE